MILHLPTRFSPKFSAEKKLLFSFLLNETVFILFFVFLALSFIEALLPTFISARLNFGIFGGGILLFFGFVRWFDLHFDIPLLTLSQRKQYFLIGTIALWGCSTITLSVLKFPWWSIPLFLLSIGLGLFFILRSLRQ